MIKMEHYEDNHMPELKNEDKKTPRSILKN